MTLIIGTAHPFPVMGFCTGSEMIHNLVTHHQKFQIHIESFLSNDWAF